VLHRGVAKDRSAPFSRKHRRYWLPVTGGMILIGIINVAIGYWMWPDTSLDRVPERIVPVVPRSQYAKPASDAGAASPDARIDASSDAAR
jgi:hypothetical protein